jgi:hypothetical protein
VTRVATALRGLVERVPRVRLLAGAALVVALIATLAVTGLLGGLFSGERGALAAARLVDTRSSWIPGQPSLANASGYLAVAARAEQLAQQRAGERAGLLKRIEAAKKARAARARKSARDRYLAARRAAMARYRAALRQNAKDRAAAAARRRHQQELYNAALAKYRRALIIRPGRECSLPNVKRRYRCHSGTKPHQPLPPGP